MQDRRAVRGGERWLTIEVVGEDRGDALVGERADLERAGRDRLGPGGIEAAEQTQHAQAGPEALLGVWPIGEHGDDQRLCVRADAAGLTVEPLGVPFGIAPMGARHVVRIGAVTRPAMAPCMGGDPFAAVEYLDRARRQAGVDLLAEQRMRHRVEAVSYT